MATLTTVTVPNIGVFAQIPVTEVLVAVGDAVQVDTPLIVVASDKATMTITSTNAGVVAEVLVQVGSGVSKGDPVVTLVPPGEDPPAAAPGAPGSTREEAAWRR